MKKRILIFGIIGFLLLGLFNYFLTTQPCLPPDRPTSLPKEAIWKGGCDGGNWIELVSIKEEKIRFRIYRDWNGKLILDADFKYKDCNSFKLTDFNWTEYISYYDEGLEIYENFNLNKCKLEPIYPAYKSEELE